MIVIWILSILLVLAIGTGVLFIVLWSRDQKAIQDCQQPVSACNYSGCDESVFKVDDIYSGVGVLPMQGGSINVPMAIKILTLNKSTSTPTTYSGTFGIYKHDGATGGIVPEFYYTYGGCEEQYWYSPSSCKFSYTKSECTKDKELPPILKNKPGDASNCCSGTACKGKHSGANTVIRNIDYISTDDKFVITLYNNDNQKASTFDLKKGTWPSKFIKRDEEIYKNGCVWQDEKCYCS
jgi:hypothetical protein